MTSMDRHTSPNRPTRIGMIVPSSNTCLEPQSYRILGDRDGRHHPLHPDSGHPDCAGRFIRQAVRPRRHARGRRLLATADVDVIAWNGTSGSWLGSGHDRDLVLEITDATGIPATTSTLAYLEAFRSFRTERIGLFTPYTADVNEAIIKSYEREGIKTVSHRCLGLSDNESFGRVTDDELRPGSRELAADAPDALIYLCTNLYGANIGGRNRGGHGRPGAGLGCRHAVALPETRRLPLAGTKVGHAARRLSASIRTGIYIRTLSAPGSTRMDTWFTVPTWSPSSWNSSSCSSVTSIFLPWKYSADSFSFFLRPKMPAATPSQPRRPRGARISRSRTPSSIFASGKSRCRP